MGDEATPSTKLVLPLSPQEISARNRPSRLDPINTTRNRPSGPESSVLIRGGTVTSLAPLTRTGIHRVAVPLSDSPLGSVNVYLIESDNGPILIDTAWQTADALAAIEGALADIGARVEDLSLIVLTHGHPDHTGLAAPLRERSGAPIALHPADWPFVDPARREDADYYSKSVGWMRLNGMPDQEQGMARGSRRAMYNRNPPFLPDRQLAD